MNKSSENICSIFTFVEMGGYCLTDTQKQLCIDLIKGNITKDEYLYMIFNENMGYLWQNINA